MTYGSIDPDGDKLFLPQGLAIVSNVSKGVVHVPPWPRAHSMGK